MKKVFAAGLAALVALSAAACTDAETQTKYRRTETTQQIYNEGELVMENRTEYTYDANGNPTTRSYNDGVLSAIQVPGELDEKGNLTCVLHQDGEGVTQGGVYYTYGEDGKVSVSEFKDGDQVTQTTYYTYDAQGNLVRYELQVHTTQMVMVGEYTYDEAGNQTSVTMIQNGQVASRVETQYDADGRLNQETSYQNEEENPSSVTQYTYDAESRTLTGVTEGQTTVITYDEAGNEISREIYVDDVIYHRLTTTWEKVPAE